MLSPRQQQLSVAGSTGTVIIHSRRSSSSSEADGREGRASAAATSAADSSHAADLPLSTLRLSSVGGTPRGSHGGDETAAAGFGSSSAADNDGPAGRTPSALNLKGLAPEALKHRVVELDSQVKEWRGAWEDAERQLRTMREEVARLESMSQITDRDALYLRSVIVSGFESGELPPGSAMFGVLARLLHFSPVEMGRIKQHATGKSAGGISSLVLGAVAGGPAVGGGGIRR
eukprot:GHRR01004289.1.p1 GENE.GHRR01004289.1~~GHRR01004289.1.p1  ORF type:complete len:265 (+),score=82.23 GHRR01004289.1:105-797(+)